MWKRILTAGEAGTTKLNNKAGIRQRVVAERKFLELPSNLPMYARKKNDIYPITAAWVLGGVNLGLCAWYFNDFAKRGA